MYVRRQGSDAGVCVCALLRNIDMSKARLKFVCVHAKRYSRKYM